MCKNVQEDKKKLLMIFFLHEPGIKNKYYFAIHNWLYLCYLAKHSLFCCLQVAQQEAQRAAFVVD